MATVSKPSLKVSSGGAQRRTSSAGFVEFTCASNQYAIVSMIESSVSSGTGTLTVGGATVYQVTATSPGPFLIYVGPSLAFGSSLAFSSGSGVNSFSYVIFENT